jgi:mRNA interferase YafQ
MLTPVRAGRFKRDVKRLVKRGWDMDKMKAVIVLLCEQKPLPVELDDHQLTGNLKDFRDLHIEDDWVLLYRIAGTDLELAATGTHTDLFG